VLTRMAAMRQLRYLVEYAVLRLVLLLIDCLSIHATVTLMRGLGGSWFLLDRRRARIAEDNVLRSGIAGRREEARRIARASFQHLGVVIAESLKSGRVPRGESLSECVSLSADPETLSLLNDPAKGIILASGHLGNWYMGARALSDIKPVVAIARRMNNPYTDRLMEKRLPGNRFRMTPKREAKARRFVSTLRNGEALAILIDQHARDRAMMIDFFGTPASTYTTPALLHLITGSPLCFGYCLRRGPMSYELKILPPLTSVPGDDRDRVVRDLLDRLNRHLEEVIRQHPEQYLWAHRRWKGSPSPSGRA